MFVFKSGLWREKSGAGVGVGVYLCDSDLESILCDRLRCII